MFDKQTSPLSPGLSAFCLTPQYLTEQHAEHVAEVEKLRASSPGLAEHVKAMDFEVFCEFMFVFEEVKNMSEQQRADLVLGALSRSRTDI